MVKTPVRGVDDTRVRDVQRTVSQADRLALSADTCRLHGREISGAVERVYVYEAAMVAYCSTHKVASTYWTRIFRWLYNDTRVGHVSSPLDISKLETHLLPFKKLRVRDVARNYQDRALVEASYRFLVTREPFARLWSVYIDKFLLPDNYFWSYYSPRVKASVYSVGDGRQGRQIHRSPAVDVVGDPMGKRSASALYQPNGGSLSTLRDIALLKGAKPESGNSRAVWKGNGIQDTRVVHQPLSIKTNRHGRRPECLDVTFDEFIRYIVNVAGESTGEALDDHFRPIHYGCNPCKFQPHFIGRMESMRVDSGTVLGRMGLAHLLPELDASNHVQQEINMLIDFNYELVVTRGYQRHCVTSKDLERRLIKAFVYNGYIAEESESVLNRGLPMGRERLKKAVTKMYEQSNRTSADIKRQRAKFKTEAYKKIPLDVLYSLQQVFHWDFELFGYDALPSELFQR